LAPGAGDTAKQEVTVAGQLLTHLEEKNIAFKQVTQADIDAWLVDGPSTRYLARGFVKWAAKAGPLPVVTIPNRTTCTSPIRVAATLLLLYAQPVTRISRMRVEDVVITDKDIRIRFGAEPAHLPGPVAD